MQKNADRCIHIPLYTSTPHGSKTSTENQMEGTSKDLESYSVGGMDWSSKGNRVGELSGRGDHKSPVGDIRVGCGGGQMAMRMNGNL